MSDHEQIAYYRRRQEQERHRAEFSSKLEARTRHSEMADAYAALIESLVSSSARPVLTIVA